MRRIFNRHIKVVIIFTVALLLSCREPVSKHEEKIEVRLILADSVSASYLIGLDPDSNFFRYLTDVDKSIQMKQKGDTPPSVEQFKKYLATKVGDFTIVEESYLKSVVHDALRKIARLNRDLIPDSVFLVKIKPDIYGDEAYFTRDKVIYIPQSALNVHREKYLERVLIHELWHLISRYHEDIREKSYEVIGFEKLNECELKITDYLRDRLLTNPDAPQISHYIRVADDGGQEFNVIPIIYSNSSSFSSDKPDFFDYLEFSLFRIDSMCNMVEDADQEKFFNSVIIDYKRKTGNNTDYIIHPEEIIADNFMLGVLSYESNNFSEIPLEGKTILESLIKLWQSFKKEN
mgnify:CR=1 FL=1